MVNMVIIHDDSTFRRLLAEHCSRLRYETDLAGGFEEGKRLLSNQQADLVFLDVRFQDGNGLELLPYIQELSSSPEVIIITGMGDANGAKMPIKNGNWFFC